MSPCYLNLLEMLVSIDLEWKIAGRRILSVHLFNLFVLTD